MTTAAPDPRTLAGVAAALVAATALAAIVTALAFGAAARTWLHFGFVASPESAGVAMTTFVDNVRLAAAAAIAAAVASLRWIAHGSGAGASPSIAEWVVRGMGLVCDATVVMLVALNVVIVGGSFGAYGWQMAAVVLPHGPIELAGYCVALDLHRRARQGPLTRTAWAWSLGLCVALLGGAALLETFVRC